jgi:hypothetical protein
LSSFDFLEDLGSFLVLDSFGVLGSFGALEDLGLLEDLGSFTASNLVGDSLGSLDEETDGA